MASSDKNKNFFEQQTELMRVWGKFRGTGPEHNTTLPPDSDQPLLLSQMISPTGGSRVLISRADWLALIRVWKLTPRRFSGS